MSLRPTVLKRFLDGRRTRMASLPWDELEAEAARQGCSPADIFFDLAGRGDPRVAALFATRIPDPADDQTVRPPSQRAAWRGYDPLPLRGRQADGAR